jgi:hypothetical protein
MVLKCCQVGHDLRLEIRVTGSARKLLQSIMHVLKVTFDFVTSLIVYERADNVL